MERRLAAILSADVAGYTKMMAQDEVATLETLDAYRSIMGGLVKQHGGRVVDMVGDNLLAEFPSAVDAVQCSLEIQRQLGAQNEDRPAETKMNFRIGVNVGDLIVVGERIVGDGVNIAARIEAEAPPGGVAMSRAVLDQVEGKLPIHALDKGDFSLKNVKKPVRIFEVRSEPADDNATKTKAHDRGVEPHVPGFGGRSAIAVLPFRNLSNDPSQEYFADGLVEDLITSLAGLRIYPVISRNSSFTYKSKTVDAREAGKELGAHYIVTGSVRKAGERLRVNAELVDSHDGRQLWSGRYDRQISDFFDVQDEITAAIAGAVGPALSQSEMLHAIRRAPQNLDAWDCIHRGMWHLFRYTKQGVAKARAWGMRALELQPTSATAYCLIAFSRMYEVIYQWTESRDEPLREAMEAAEQAVAADKDDPMALTALGFACSLAGFRDRAVAVLERAVQANPSSALAFWSLGATLATAGRADEAIPMVEKAIRLSPQDPLMNEFLFTIGSAHFLAGRYEEAIEFAQRSLDLKGDQPGAWRILAAANALMGRLGEARRSVGHLMRLTPDLTEDRLRVFLREEDVELYLKGLRLAGWQG
ncbi:MAG: adenylate/guanylate cyclase domain-containing protein [Gammaproteobacteria bacterium]|nr:MAG: adenylate/guanylate cyclase domain-containing protein [Gammaproteobacteria bacterium]